MRTLTFSLSQKIVGAFLASVVVFSLAGCNSESDSGNKRFQPNQANIPSVEAVKARYGSLPLSERLSGTVIANNQVDLYPEISGKIDEVLVQNGDKVRKGTPLVRIKDDQYKEQLRQAKAGLQISEAQLKQVQASLNQIEGQYKRTKALADKNLSSDMQMEQLEAQLKSAQADVQLAEARVEQNRSTLKERQDQLDKTVVRSPVNGTIGQRNAEVGMQVNTGTKLFIVGDLSSLRVEVVLTENALNDIEVGQTALVYAGADENNMQPIKATLSRISPFLNTVTRSTEAEIDVKNEGNLLRPGMFVPVDILFGESQQATLIPTSALYTNPNTGEEGVFVATSLGSEVQAIEDSSADGPEALTEPIDVQFKPISVIARGRMELGVSGIDPGSWVITVGQNLLSQGRNQARVRTSTWERILALQGLQRQDLLKQLLKEQDSSKNTL